jgi:glycosyltransferase involved in cell wall biosynthesis
MSTYQDSREIASKVAIATTTFYKDTLADKNRSTLALNLAQEAKKEGYELIVVDGGSSDEFLENLRSTGAHLFKENKGGMGVGRRQAIREALTSQKPVLAWVEPEKGPYISQIAKTARPILMGEADLVVPRRESLDSYPTAQRYGEPLGNTALKNLTGLDIDYFFGPKTWHNQMTPYFLNYDGKPYGDLWDSILFPLFNMARDNRRIKSIDVVYEHPSVQKTDEDNDFSFYVKRIKQLDNLIGNAADYWEKTKTISPVR